MTHDGSMTNLWGSCQRASARYRPNRAGTVTIEIRFSDGDVERYALLDISLGGISFGAHDVRVAEGARFSSATLSDGDISLEVQLEVTHVTEGFATGRVAGARMCTATPDDAEKFDRLMDRLEVMPD